MKNKKNNKKLILILAIGVFGLVVLGTGVVYSQFKLINDQKQELSKKFFELTNQFNELDKNYQELKNSDQIKINKQLVEEIGNIQKGYQDSVKLYERILEISSKGNILKIETNWAEIISLLSKKNYASASALMDKLSLDIKKIEEQATITKIPENIPVKDTPPSSGQSKQVVKTDVGDFVVNIISANLSNTKLVVDTASNSDCKNDCPVLPLAEFAKRSGAFAAINGPYFCPAIYPNCSDKKNSFDTLLMNKNKTYFNSDNNVYSSNPVAIFSSNSRFVEKGSEWGRDTSVDAVIMSRPLLVFNNEVKFFGNNDFKETSRGNRSFLGASDNTVYIGIVYSATVAETAKVVAKLGIKNAINLDSGGSSAFWSNGKYLAGPGRDLPFGILLVKR